MKALFLTSQNGFNRVYGGGRRERVEQLCDMYPTVVEGKQFDEHAPQLSETEVIFSTWGMPSLTLEQIAKMPKLKAVFYGAGTVQSFARPFLTSGVKVFSAWAANAIPVAEFTLASIIFSLKQAHPCLRDNAIEGRGYKPKTILGVYDTTVGIISMGMIGRKVCELLKSFQVNIVTHDPFVSDEVLESLNAKRVDLDELFRVSDVVSLHAPNLESTKGMITGEHFRMMRPNTTFINTARGAIIHQDEMIEALRERSDISAHLDVVTPDPDDHLTSLPNVFLTPHIAGSLGNECWRMADFMIEEFEAWRDGKATRYQVTEAMLETMA